MSFSNIPSEKQLEELANNLFKAAPKNRNALEINNIFSDNSFTEALEEIEQTSDSMQEPNSFDISNPQTAHKDPFSSTGLIIPHAVSGDGSSRFYKQSIEQVSTEKSQQAIENPVAQKTDSFTTDSPNSFNLSDPQTSFPDKHVYDGKIPPAITGSGEFPNSHHKHVGNNNGPILNDLVLPYQSASWPEVDQAATLFTQIQLAKFGSQFPETSDPSFYFNTFVSPAEKAREQITTNKHFDVHAVRKDFPILNEYINGHRLVWFDNAATTQKPQSVIDRLSYFYKHENSNIHRAAHDLAARATDAYEEARSIVKRFINASSTNEIVFTRGTTESINLVAQSWGEQHLKEGDQIIISHLEHHANIVPWQLLSKKKGFTIKIIPVNDQGELLLDEYARLLNEKTKLVSFTHVSNALGTVTPAKAIIDLAHQAGAKVLLDGAQSISHLSVDLQYLNPDFFVFSGHKIFGPTGIGVLYGKEDLLNNTQPYQGGGNMIKDVTFERTQFQLAPNRFEAGTGNIADAVGLGAALEYVEHIGLEQIAHYEHELLEYGTKLFKQIPGVTLIGTAKDKASVMSFTLKGYSNDEIGQELNQYGIAVRTGHHCAQPILRRLGYETSVRPSFAFYNTFGEIDLMANIVERLANTKGNYF